MSKKCVCGHEMTRHDWKHEWVCHRCGRKKPIEAPQTYTVFECYKCHSRLYAIEDENFPKKLEKIAGCACHNCGEQAEGLWRLLGRAEEFDGEIIVDWEEDEDE